MIITGILLNELQAVGIDAVIVTSKGVVIAADGVHIENRSDVAAVIAEHQANTYDVDEYGQLRESEIVFDVPIVAPAGTFGDVYVAPPKTEDTAAAALQTAEIEAKKTGRKSIAKIVLNLAEKYLPDLEIKIKKAKL